MIWWMWLIIILAIIGLVVIIPTIFRMVGFGIKVAIKVSIYMLCIIILIIVIILVADLIFDAGWWDIISNWLKNIGSENKITMEYNKYFNV